MRYQLSYQELKFFVNCQAISLLMVLAVLLHSHHLWLHLITASNWFITLFFLLVVTGFVLHISRYKRDRRYWVQQSFIYLILTILTFCFILIYP